MTTKRYDHDRHNTDYAIHTTMTTTSVPDHDCHNVSSIRLQLPRLHGDPQSSCLPVLIQKNRRKRISVKRQDPKEGRPREDAHGNSTLTEEMLPHPDRSDPSPGHGPSPPVLESLGPRRGAHGAPGGATGLGAEWNLECHAEGNDPQKGLTV